MSRLAIIQNADTPQIESTALMLRAAGYDRIAVCGDGLRDELKGIGCDTVLSVRQVMSMGYDAPDPSIEYATPADVDRCDLFCEIKVRNLPHLLRRWPRLDGRLSYLRVNGGQPEICERGGDEVNLPCPVVTACLWYGTERYRHGRTGPLDSPRPQRPPNNEPPLQQLLDAHSGPVSEDRLRAYAAEAHANRHRPDGTAYVCWPPYPRMAEYLDGGRTEQTARTGHDAPYGLAHYMPSWGFGEILNRVADLGVQLFGDRTPKGQIPHAEVRRLARTALALVHLKAVDCPGWALYEALLSGCPVVTSRLLNSRMLAYPLLEDGVTCLEYGVPASMDYGRGPTDYDRCVNDIAEALERLKNPNTNTRIGEAGRERLLGLMWSNEKAEDAESFREFCKRNFK